MPRLGFAIDNRACIGCHACTVACKSEHDVPLGVNRTWVKYIEKGTFPDATRTYSVQRCNHCEDAPCVEICPVTALFTRPDGVVDFDNSRCIACKACMNACPYDAIYLDPETQTAAKCNYCTHRLDAGYEPACVVVCPVEAIVSGDLDDPKSRIAQLDQRQKVQYPKVEKGTSPKLFYVGGETAALDPTEAGPGSDTLWGADPDAVPLPIMSRRTTDGADVPRARRAYDAKTKPTPWGWMVSAYITTKAVAAGIVIVAYLAYLQGALTDLLPTSVTAVSLLFLGLTGALLVGDLKQPQRFLYVLLRPQWKSWLVKGAYLITAFAALVPISWWLTVSGADRSVMLIVGGITAIAAATVAIYTAFLLAQAKGRDYWQNPLLVVTMLVDSWIGGAAALAVLASSGLLEIEAAMLRFSLCLGLASSALLAVAEFVPTHPTRDASLAAKMIVSGRYRRLFWLGAVGGGLLAPAALLFAELPLAAPALLLVVGMAVRNHLLVQAPQQVALR